MRPHRPVLQTPAQPSASRSVSRTLREHTLDWPVPDARREPLATCLLQALSLWAHSVTGRPITPPSPDTVMVTISGGETSFEIPAPDPPASVSPAFSPPPNTPQDSNRAHIRDVGTLLYFVWTAGDWPGTGADGSPPAAFSAIPSESWRGLLQGLLTEDAPNRWTLLQLVEFQTNPTIVPVLPAWCAPTMDPALAGGDPNATAARPAESARPHARAPEPVTFGGVVCRTPEILASALAGDWPAASSWLQRLTLNDQERVAALVPDAHRIELRALLSDRRENEHRRLLRLLRRLNPNAPLIFMGALLGNSGERAALAEDAITESMPAASASRADYPALRILRTLREHKALQCLTELTGDGTYSEEQRQWFAAGSEFETRAAAFRRADPNWVAPTDDQTLSHLFAFVVDPANRNRIRQELADDADARACSWFRNLGNPATASLAELWLIQCCRVPAQRAGIAERDRRERAKRAAADRRREQLGRVTRWLAGIAVVGAIAGAVAYEQATDTYQRAAAVPARWQYAFVCKDELAADAPCADGEPSESDPLGAAALNWRPIQQAQVDLTRLELDLGGGQRIAARRPFAALWQGVPFVGALRGTAIACSADADPGADPGCPLQLTWNSLQRIGRADLSAGNRRIVIRDWGNETPPPSNWAAAPGRRLAWLRTHRASLLQSDVDTGDVPVRTSIPAKDVRTARTLSWIGEVGEPGAPVAAGTALQVLRRARFVSQPWIGVPQRTFTVGENSVGPLDTLVVTSMPQRCWPVRIVRTGQQPPQSGGASPEPIPDCNQPSQRLNDPGLVRIDAERASEIVYLVRDASQRVGYVRARDLGWLPLARVAPLSGTAAEATDLRTGATANPLASGTVGLLLSAPDDTWARFVDATDGREWLLDRRELDVSDSLDGPAQLALSIWETAALPTAERMAGIARLVQYGLDLNADSASDAAPPLRALREHLFATAERDTLAAFATIGLQTPPPADSPNHCRPLELVAHRLSDPGGSAFFETFWSEQYASAPRCLEAALLEVARIATQRVQPLTGSWFPGTTTTAVRFLIGRLRTADSPAEIAAVDMLRAAGPEQVNAAAALSEIMADRALQTGAAAAPVAAPPSEPILNSDSSAPRPEVIGTFTGRLLDVRGEERPISLTLDSVTGKVGSNQLRIGSAWPRCIYTLRLEGRATPYIDWIPRGGESSNACKTVPITRLRLDMSRPQAPELQVEYEGVQGAPSPSTQTTLQPSR